MKLIAFAGRAGSGKNTAARGLSAHYETSELAMADPLYDALGALIGLSPFDDNDLRTLCEDRDFKRAAHKALGGLSPREALQQLGDWVRSSLGQDFLLRRAEERLAILEDFQFQVDLAVVTDVRTEREAAWVREHGGLLIHVSRADQSQGTGEDVPAHSTENPLTLAQGDAYVFNNGTVEDLHAAVHQVVLCWAYGVAA
ncbi:MAG: hypothetical protein CL549_15875 [Alcanivorax sp.]|nr:hypothetical protein [Alcanivorax sp.]MAY11937.1 hypothetical protein [Alcanivorax sp.]MBI56747.1 hypothetical protein [Alcanivorax sp.]HCE39704.1 hypothetical protein [Alcanivorax sp.]|tara:strand:+ start:405 stop:1001 length:597 start_codon:yes stop_codon:yes gene_type:complete